MPELTCVLFLHIPCKEQIGYIETLADDQLTGSSRESIHKSYERSRLHTQLDGDDYGGWTPETNSVGEFIQADLGAVRRIEKVATQGLSSRSHWVTSYKFGYSVDRSTHSFIQNNAGSEVVFTGNIDKNTVVEHTFDTAVEARYVRVYPQTWTFNIAMRWEVYGCEIGKMGGLWQ